MDNMDNKKYLVIKATRWNFKNSVSYSVVSEKSYDLKKACDVLLASETMLDEVLKDDTTFHLQEIKFVETDKPLILDQEVKGVDHELI